MSSGLLVADTYSYDFPYDWEAPAYHWDSIVCLKEVIQSLECFLNVINEQAYQFFFETAQQAEIDLIGCIDGVCRPATQEASKKYLECANEWGQRIDWELSILEIHTLWLFNVEQIDVMINTAVRGHPSQFSIRKLIEQKKSDTTLSNEPLIENNMYADFDKDIPTYPPELDAALQAWRAISANHRSKGIGISTQIERWLEINKPDLSEQARKRIGIVANWNKQETRQKKAGKPLKSK